VTAVPSEGYQFDKWSGDIDDNPATDATIHVVMDKARNITADFVPLYAINVDISPTLGGTVTIATSSGSLSTSGNESSLSTQYASGTTVELSAAAAADYSFEKWSGDIGDNVATDATIHVEMDQARNITADFVPLYTINIDISPTLGGTATIATPSGSLSTSDNESSLSVQYASGTIVELSAAATAGYSFEKWFGDIEDNVATDAIIHVEMDRAHNITADFVPLYTINVDIDPILGGTATIATSSGSLSTSADQPSLSVQYISGTIVELSAAAAAGYRFDGWQGDILDSQGNVLFVVDSPKTVVAQFSALPSSNSFPWGWTIGGGVGFLLVVLLLVKFVFVRAKKPDGF